MTGPNEFNYEPTARCVATIESYLAAIGRGDLTAANGHLAPGARLVFPGGRIYPNLDALAKAAGSRYRWIDKHRDRYDTAIRQDGGITVISLGRLFGENLQGVAFDGVRYIDVFTLRDNLVHEQIVFNDLGETGVLNVRTADELCPELRPNPAAP